MYDKNGNKIENDDNSHHNDNNVHVDLDVDLPHV